jgi:hypothetical protein
MIAAITSLLTSAGLGIGAGINTYATLLVFGAVARWQPQHFPSESARFFASTPVLIVLAVLYTIEFVADKIPAVDHIWDMIHTFIRPIAGAVAGWAAVAHGTLPQGVVVIATIVAGGAALATHGTKASVRAASTATTGGLGNPVLSLGEDIVAFGTSTVAIFLPWLVLLLLALGGAMGALVVCRLRRRSAR